MPVRPPVWTTVLSLVCRLALAAVWLVAGYLKAVDPLQSAVAVRAYQVLPEGMVNTVATTLPFLEIGLGLLLLLGIGVRATAVASILLLAVFIAGVASSWARGLSIDCGCFGGGGAVADAGAGTYVKEIFRDLGFAALAVWLVFRPRSWVALGPRSQPDRDVSDEDVMT